MMIALAQIEVEPAAVDRNVSRATAAIATAAADGAELVVLPELFNVGYFAFEAYQRLAEPLDGDTLTTIADAAADTDVAVVAGSIVEDVATTAERGVVPVPASDGLANTAVAFGPDGDRRAVYRKHHLFGYESAEAELLTPGEGIDTFTVGGFTVGVTTCYDLRFPELYRRLADRGVTLVVVPSAWPYPRVEHWKTLPRARAIENLAYVAAANGVGAFDDGTLLGRSTVYDPWGTTLASASDEPAVVTAALDPERVASVRDSFPALDDRRL